MKALGCILPSGNSSEFPELDAELALRGVQPKIRELASGGRIYEISADQLHKLPHDKKGPYIGDDDSGHGIYAIPEAWWTNDW